LSVDIVALLEGRDGFVLAWDTILEGLDARTHINLVTDILAGRKSPEEFAREMQKLN
jgi:raffinose/stachyose/melibiose transport system substrate-binding protein